MTLKIMFTVWVYIAACVGVASARLFDGLELAEKFSNPPHEAKPWVYWWFQGGYGSFEGMASDLAAMKEKGIGGVMHMQTCNAGGRPVPAQPKMLSPEWDSWFGEALRLAKSNGMTMAASVVDGWAHGGGWVGKEDGAKQLVYAETQFDGPGAPSEPLPVPFSRIGVYHDVAVVAFKEKSTRAPVPLSVNANNTPGGYCGQEYWPAAHAVDNDPETFWRAGCPAVLNVTYAQPITVSGAIVAGMTNAGPKEAEILASDDGRTFKSVSRFSMAPGEQKRVVFEAATGRVFRLSISSAHVSDLRLAEFQLLRQGDEPVLRRGIKCWDLKSANFGGGWGGWPEHLYNALEEEYSGADACDVTAEDVVDLSSHLKPDGRLDWQFPAGRWTVMRFGWTAIAAPARMGNGGGYEVDVLSVKGADLMMDTAAKRMRELSVKNAGGAPIIFHTDSWEIGADNKGQQPTWTDDFREQFRKKRGYDLLPYLPAMARRVVGGREVTFRFLWDFRATVADLLSDYYGRLQQRAHEMNGGMNSESGYGSFPHPHMDGLKVFGRSDRPMAEFWHPFPMWGREYLQEVDVMRTAASGARIYGNRYVQAETLTFNPVMGLFTPPANYRRTLHEAWARGLNQAVIHKYTHQPSDEKPGMLDYDIFNRNFSWWPLAEGFIGYMGRCQYLLQQGDFVADAAFFVGDGASRFVPGKSALNPALPSSYDFDGINAEVLLTRAKVKGGRLILPLIPAPKGEEQGTGPSYRYLVLADPQCTKMTAATLAGIRRLVDEGLTLVGRRPEGTPGLGAVKQNEADFKVHADALWGEKPGDRGERKVGRGRVIWGASMVEVFAGDAVLPDCEAKQGGKLFDISWLHRSTGSGEEVYFLANPMGQALDLAITCRANGRTVRLFDPLEGSVRVLPEYSIGADGRMTIPLRFEAEQALFIVISGKAQKPGTVMGGARNFAEKKPVLDITGPWKVSFDAKWVKPSVAVTPEAGQVSLTFEKLADWSQSLEPSIKGYSGLAVYRKTFDCPVSASRLNSGVFLALGAVKEMARVELNGRNLGVVWCAPWRVTIPAGLIKEKGNELVITVANTWNNRLWADGQLPDKERLTKVGHGLQNGRGLQPAGLLGPVVLFACDKSE